MHTTSCVLYICKRSNLLPWHWNIVCRCLWQGLTADRVQPNEPAQVAKTSASSKIDRGPIQHETVQPQSSSLLDSRVDSVRRGIYGVFALCWMVGGWPSKEWWLRLTSSTHETELGVQQGPGQFKANPCKLDWETVWASRDMLCNR